MATKLQYCERCKKKARIPDERAFIICNTCLINIGLLSLMADSGNVDENCELNFETLYEVILADRKLDTKSKVATLKIWEETDNIRYKNATLRNEYINKELLINILEDQMESIQNVTRDSLRDWMRIWGIPDDEAEAKYEQITNTVDNSFDYLRGMLE